MPVKKKPQYIPRCSIVTVERLLLENLNSVQSAEKSLLVTSWLLSVFMKFFSFPSQKVLKFS